MPLAGGNKKKKNYKTKSYKPPSKAGRIVLRNLPFSVTEDDIKKSLLQFGKIREVTLPRRKDGKLMGCGFVQFTRKTAAEEAVKQWSGQNFMGRVITVELALPKHEYVAKRIIEGHKEERAVESSEEDNDPEQEEEEGRQKTNKGGKRGRIIVRNLSFSTTEEKLRKHFEEYGEIIDIKILKKPNGLMVGCGFVEFGKKKHAIKAILGRSGKEFLGRPIICDWALSKDRYMSQVQNRDVAVKEEKEVQGNDLSGVKVKTERISDQDSDDEPSVKEEPISDDSDDTNEFQDSDKEMVEEEEEDDDNTDDSDDSDDDRKPSLPLKKKGDIENDFGSPRKRPRVVSNDVTEGCTVFIKNIPFSVTSEQLQECVEHIGPVHYALVCIDPLTEHSRGTGFVKFKKKEDADKCLENGNDLVLQDTVLEFVRALSRDDIKNKNEKKKEKKVKDNRHLYLVKEGVILAGSPAARDVSVMDMEKRLKIEQWKTQMLRNLNMFVSNTRLIVYNVPPTWNDNQIRQLFKQHGGAGADVMESRIMRDLKNVDANGVGKSKEYAFVRFTNQEHALQALRSINNNPNIFTKLKRPIVTFSIENKAIHKIKQKRAQKSKICNPTYQTRTEQMSTPSNRRARKQRNKQQTAQETEENNSYTGVIAKPGNKRLRTKFNLRTQCAAHIQNVRKEKHKLKMKKKVAEQRQMTKREPKIKRKHPVEKDSFGHLVNKYKSKLLNQESRKKWYE